MIVAMKRATIAFLAESLPRVAEELQKCGEFMPTESESSKSVRTLTAPVLEEEADTALKAYSGYRKKSGMLSPPQFYTEEQFSADDGDEKTHVIKAVELYEQLNSVRLQIKQCDDERAALLPFSDLQIDAAEQAGTKYTSLLIGKMPYAAKAKTTRPLDRLCEEYGVEYETFHEEAGQKYFCVSVYRDDSQAFLTEAQQNGFEQLTLPYKSGTCSQALEENEKKKEQLTFIEASLQSQLQEESGHAGAVELFYDREKARADRSELPAQVTENTVVLTGWVRSDRVDVVESAVAAATDVYAAWGATYGGVDAAAWEHRERIGAFAENVASAEFTTPDLGRDTVYVRFYTADGEWSETVYLPDYRDSSRTLVIIVR